MAIAHNISENVENTPTHTYKIYLELIPPQQQIELLEQYLTQRIPQTVKGLSEERLQQVKNDLREALDLAKLYPQSTIAQRGTNLQKLTEQIDPSYREARKLESSSLNELLALVPAASLENRQRLLYQAQAKITNDSDLTIFNEFLEKTVLIRKKRNNSGQVVHGLHSIKVCSEEMSQLQFGSLIYNHRPNTNFNICLAYFIKLILLKIPKPLN